MPLTHFPRTKWLPFRRRRLCMHFHEWKVLYFDLNFNEVCSSGSNWQYTSVCSGNGLAPNRRQAITWTNGSPVHWRIYAALGGDELTQVCISDLGHHGFRSWIGAYSEPILVVIPIGTKAYEISVHWRIYAALGGDELTQVCISDLGHHGFRSWIGAYSEPILVVIPIGTKAYEI